MTTKNTCRVPSKKVPSVAPAKKLPKYKGIQERNEVLNKDADKRSVLDSIDRPIKPLVIEMNRIGLRTTFSCCGYSYTNEEEPKSHAKWAQVLFYNTNDASYKALEEAAKGTGWGIIDNDTSVNGEKCLLLNIPVSVWKQCDNLAEAIHDYERKLHGIILLVELLRKLPSVCEGAVIHDGNEGRKNFYKDEWMVEPKQPATVIWKKKEEVPK